MNQAIDVRRAGASAAALARHYALPPEFFALWLGPDLVYSCAWWEDDDGGDGLPVAQHRKLDWFAAQAAVRGARVLDVGCGWGAGAERFATVHGAARVVALNLCREQAEVAAARCGERVEVRDEGWATHEPVAPYGAITCIEATEHFASDERTAPERVEVYRAFFERCASWLDPAGRVGLQLICLDDAGEETSHRRGPITDLIRTAIFPESMSSSLSEMVLGWETHFRVRAFRADPDHYVRTMAAWLAALRRRADDAIRLVGEEEYRTFVRYFSAAGALFRMREQTLYRVILEKRPAPKRWVAPLSPIPHTADAEDAAGDTSLRLPASASAIRSHYDVGNDFYESWLGPSMSYSSGLWDRGPDGEPPDDDAAQAAKVSFAADHLLPAAGTRGGSSAASGARVLDVGCGWGAQWRLLRGMRPDVTGIGLTLSPSQAEWLAAHPIDGLEVRVESWADHDPDAPYDAIMSFGAFEHFARDGAPREERVAAYRAFFRRCHRWLRPGGRLALETITHDDAPETEGPLGRGAMADFVLRLYPESLSPHLFELVLGFEPWFRVVALRPDGDDFARTVRAWSAKLRQHSDAATEAAGGDVVRAFRRYLAASEVQFRLHEITNYRAVLERRPSVRR